MPRRTGGGHIRLHNRTVDNAVEIVDAGVDVTKEHYEEIRETEAQQMEDRTRREYQCHIKHLYRFWVETHPAYFEVGTCVLGEAKNQDREAFHHNNDHGSIYQGVNVTLVKASLVANKKRGGNG